MEVYVAPEMVAAGVEAMRAAKVECFEEAEIVIEVYLAMYLMGLRAREYPEPIQ